MTITRARVLGIAYAAFREPTFKDFVASGLPRGGGKALCGVHVLRKIRYIIAMRVVLDEFNCTLDEWDQYVHHGNEGTLTTVHKILQDAEDEMAPFFEAMLYEMRETTRGVEPKRVTVPARPFFSWACLWGRSP